MNRFARIAPIRVANRRTKTNLKGRKTEGFQTGGLPDLDLSFLFCPFWDFPDFSGIFPICSGMVRGFSRFVLFLFLGLLRAPTRNSPERVSDTIWAFPEKKWETPGFGNPPGLASLKNRKVLNGVGADGVGMKLPMFPVNCSCLPMSWANDRN